LATLHHEHTHPAPPPRQHRLRLRNPLRATLAAGVAAGVLLGTPTAFAAPGASAASSQSEGAAADVAAIQARLTSAEETLQRLTVQAEAASGKAMKAQAELATAQEQAQRTAAELDAARVAVAESEDAVATIGREAYMGSNDTYGDMALLLAADSPTELLQQAATMEALGDERTKQLREHEAVEARQAEADRAARSAVEDRDRAARDAADAEAAANAQLAAAQKDYDAAAAEKAALDAQLKEAEIRQLALQGAQDPAASWANRQAAETAGGRVSAAGGAVAPTAGTVTSCYGQRWGTLHAGIDFAAPIGTPIYAPEGGVVVQAGPASGFGLAVAIRHGDGTITLYGHVNQFFVTTGQAVSTGQQIAEVGNRGQSTGPHLHFEVHTGGLYVNRVNPVSWLTAHGISVGSC
jgi:murein DD-endopeptidase MepM/ murein hydrolase activator NlpD